MWVKRYQLMQLIGVRRKLCFFATPPSLPACDAFAAHVTSLTGWSPWPFKINLGQSHITTGTSLFCAFQSAITNIDDHCRRWHFLILSLQRPFVTLVLLSAGEHILPKQMSTNCYRISWKPPTAERCSLLMYCQSKIMSDIVMVVSVLKPPTIPCR